MKREITITIKNRYTGRVIFEYSCVDNTDAKTVEEAVSRGISLQDAFLPEVILYRADLHGADFRGC